MTVGLSVLPLESSPKVSKRIGENRKRHMVFRKRRSKQKFSARTIEKALKDQDQRNDDALDAAVERLASRDPELGKLAQEMAQRVRSSEHGLR